MKSPKSRVRTYGRRSVAGARKTPGEHSGMTATGGGGMSAMAEPPGKSRSTGYGSEGQIMCDDHGAASQPEDTGPELSRRGFLHGTAAVAAAAGLLREFPRLPLHSPARAVASDGSPAFSMAMHVHSSFSEQTGSMQAQLFQAATNS